MTNLEHPQGPYPQGPYPQGPYQQGTYQPGPVRAQPGNGVAVASLVLGITGIVFSWWGLFTLVQVVLAVVFGAVGISKASHGASNKGLASAGLLLGLVGLGLYFVIGLVSFGLGWVI